MAVEIERKFLVDEKAWAKAKTRKSVPMRQAYFTGEPNLVFRVRIAGEKAYFTIKGKQSGITRPEFEYEIPVDDANQLMANFTENIVEKTRHYMLVEGKTWEVDVFGGLNEGLITAEIELSSPDETFEKPAWLGKEVSLDNRYANVNLAFRPFQTWK